MNLGKNQLPSAKARADAKALDFVSAIFADQVEAASAIRALIEAGFEVTSLSVVGNGYYSEDKVVGFYISNGQVRFWGARREFWGEMSELFFGVLFITEPQTRSVIALGRLATIAASAVERSSGTTRTSTIGAAFIHLGVPEDTAVRYEFAIEADGFLVMAHGDGLSIARARTILRSASSVCVDVHTYVPTPIPDLVPLTKWVVPESVANLR